MLYIYRLSIYDIPMIIDFASRHAEDIFNGISSKRSRKIPTPLHGKCCRLFDQINAASIIETLSVPPSNHLEKLKGDLRGYWSLRINNQWRIIFQWKNGNAFNVDIVDYH